MVEHVPSWVEMRKLTWEVFTVVHTCWGYGPPCWHELRKLGGRFACRYASLHSNLRYAFTSCHPLASIHWHRLGTFDTTRSVPLIGDRCVREKRCDGSHCASSAQWGVRDALEEHLPQSKWRKPCAGWRGHGKEGRLREPNADPTGVDTCGRP